MSHLFKASVILTVFFGINKIVALFRQALIARQFGLGSEIDAFNVANNLPDLVFSLFSGGALSLAFIPVFAEYIDERGQKNSWKLFSKTANILFLITLVLSLIFAIAAKPIVSSKFGISPGFSTSQNDLVVELMQINLIAMIIFSLSGLVMASLQAHKHFLLPAISPILYNVGLIVGALILAPHSGIEILSFRLPALGLGIHGLVYGTVLGAFLHLIIQVPGLVKYQFRWIPAIDFKDLAVQKVLRLMLPRIATVFLIQFMFLARDNLASYLDKGSVTALTYGYYIMQVPETLIGTAIATALLPTISQFASSKKQKEFEETLNKALRVIVASTLYVSVMLAILLPEFIELLFNFDKNSTQILIWTTRAYLIGLLSHSLLEVTVRAYYAKQDAKTPLVATILRTIVFIIAAILFFKSSGPTGLAAADSAAVTAEVIILFFLLKKTLPNLLNMTDTVIRTVFGCVFGVAVLFLLSLLPIPSIFQVLFSITLGGLIYLLFIKKELKMLIKL